MKLLIEDDQGNRSVVPVIRDEITIGRKEGNTIRLTERNVSRRHARLVQTNGELYVEDVEARYGIKKNGQKIEERAQFDEGDVVIIGDYRLTLRPEKAEASGTQDVNGQAAAEISPELQREDGPDRASQAQQVDEPDEESASEDEAAAPKGDTEIIKTEPAELVVVSSNFAGQEFPLDRNEMVIGRGEECDIIIDHRSVSNTHAKVVREGPEDYKIVDLNSSNGVKIDGEEYKSVHLERGDIVELGHVKFRFVEPGENYVFTPQPEPDEPTFDDADDLGVNPVAIGGAAVLVLAVLGGAVFMLSSDEAESSDPSKTTASSESPEDDETGAAAGDDGEGDRKIAEKIDQAKKDISAGRLEKAIGSLESVRDLRDPSPSQDEAIEQMLSKARSEQPFRRRFESARQAIKNDNDQAALADLEKIPEHSVFYSLADDKKLEKKALDGVISSLQTAVEKSNVERAKKLGDLASSYPSHRDDAEKYLAKLERKRAQAGGGGQGAASAGGDHVRTTSPSTKGGGGTGGGGREPESSEGGGGGSPAPSVSDKEAKKLFQNATKKWIRGDHAGAIDDCKRALKAGHHPCYRVIGMAHKQMGNTSSACTNFEKYLSADPSDASKIRDIMSDLDC